MKRHKRSIAAIPDPTFEQIVTRMNGMKLEEKAWVSALWLFGTRVSELVGIRARQKAGDYLYWRTTRAGTKQIKVPKYRELNEAEREKKMLPEWEVEPVRKWDVEIDPVLPIVRIRNVRTLKIKNRPANTYFVRVDRPEEETMWAILKAYLDTLSPEQALFKHRRTTGWAIVEKHLGIPAHKLRGIRATRDAVEFDLDAIDLKAKFHWASAAMPMHYAQKNARELETKYLR